VKKTIGRKASLPEGAKIGTKITKDLTVKGNKRKITFERTKKHGKNKNFSWKIKSNKPA